MSSKVRIFTFRIDDRDVSAREGETILTVAKENGIFIPTLCHVDGLTPVGACRICMVEIAGRPKLYPACVTNVEEGIQVITKSDRLTRYRRTILELIFSERNHVCSVCVSNGHCELQSLTQKLGMTHIHIPYRFPNLEVDASHDRFIMDHNRCILCTRCVRVCDEIEGAHTRDIMGRGVDARIICDMNQPWGTSETCTGCGKCVQVCPTGALVEKGKSASEMAKQQEFLPYLTLMREKKE